MSRSALPVESKREVAKAQTRRDLLKSALQLYSREGTKGLSMNKVAKGAGIAQPSFYNHFESLDALQFELSEQLKTQYLSPMRQAWVNMLKDYDSLNHEQFQLRCQQCLSMIFDSAFQNITLFQHLIEDRPRFHVPDKHTLEKGSQRRGNLGNLISELQDEWADILIQGLQLSGRTLERSDVHLCVDISAAQVHELILGCHEQRYTREQAICILSRNFDALFISLFG